MLVSYLHMEAWDRHEFLDKQKCEEVLTVLTVQEST
jgi:hypothetical protein